MVEVGPINSHPDLVGTAGDSVYRIALEGTGVVGRVVRLGMGSCAPILARHEYPRAIAHLLAQALALAALVGAGLKVAARFTVQAQGDGPVSTLVAEYATGGSLRAYARVRDEPAALALAADAAPSEVLGQGVLAFTIDQGPGFTPYQGIVSIDTQSLAASAELFFARSDQVPTRIRLASGELMQAHGAPQYCAGGMMIQRIGTDDNRADPQEAWREAQILFDTLQDDELLDPTLSVGRVAFRLFHENGVRVDEGQSLRDACSCSRERLVAVLEQLQADERAELVGPDGRIEARCEFCARVYDLSA